MLADEEGKREKISLREREREREREGYQNMLFGILAHGWEKGHDG